MEILRHPKSHPRLWTRQGKIGFKQQQERASFHCHYIFHSGLKSLQANVRIECAVSGAEALLTVFQMSMSWISRQRNYNCNSCSA